MINLAIENIHVRESCVVMLSLLIILITLAESLHPERHSKEDIESLFLGEWKNCEVLEGQIRQGPYVFSFHPQLIVRNEKSGNRITNRKKGSWVVAESTVSPDELIVVLKFDGHTKQRYTIVEAGEKHVRLRLKRLSRGDPRIVIKLNRDEQ